MVKLEEGHVTSTVTPINYNGDVKNISSGRFTIDCNHNGVDIYIRGVPREIAPLFYDALKVYLSKKGDEIYTPMVIHNIAEFGMKDDRVDPDASTYNGWILIPPGIDKRSSFFMNGLIVPDLKIKEVYKKDEVIEGYDFSSEYLGNQILHSKRNGKVTNEGNVRYIARINNPHKDSQKHPSVEIILKVDLKSELFIHNKRELESILRGDRLFWWI